MKTFFKALRVLLLLTFVTGVLYPLGMNIIGAVIFPHQANGSLILRDGQPVGSALIGQQFAQAKYFHSRPSAADYDAQASGGSNLGPSNPKLTENVAKNIDTIRRINNLSVDTPIPSDLATASASGLDPNISLAAAELQAERVAQTRNLPTDKVLAVLAEHKQTGLTGGAEFVNVLKVNLALDEIK